MKKLLEIVVLGLLLSGNAYANIYELNRCIPIQEHVAKHDKVKWSPKLFERQNTTYYLFHDKPKKMLGSDMYNVAVWVPGDAADDETISEFEEEGWNKIQRREKSSYTIDLNDKLITELIVYTDEYLDFERERIFKLTELYKEKGT